MEPLREGAAGEACDCRPVSPSALFTVSVLRISPRFKKEMQNRVKMHIISCGWRFWSFTSAGRVSLWASEELLIGIFQPTVAIWGLVGRDTHRALGVLSRTPGSKVFCLFSDIWTPLYRDMPSQYRLSLVHGAGFVM